MESEHTSMINAGKSLPRGDDLANQFIVITKILHMMPVLRAHVLKYVQDEVKHYLASPNDYMRCENGELVRKDPSKDYRGVYKDKSTRGRGW